MNIFLHFYSALLANKCVHNNNNNNNNNNNGVAIYSFTGTAIKS